MESKQTRPPPMSDQAATGRPPPRKLPFSQILRKRFLNGIAANPTAPNFQPGGYRKSPTPEVAIFSNPH